MKAVLFKIFNLFGDIRVIRVIIDLGVQVMSVSKIILYNRSNFCVKIATQIANWVAI